MLLSKRTINLTKAPRVLLSPKPSSKALVKRGVVYFQTNIPPHSYTPKEVNTKGTEQYRVFVEEKGTVISPWHDIPLVAGTTESKDKVFNFLSEIPRGTNDKMELTEVEQWNPIRQDTKKGKLRKITYMPYPWNYGTFPQTYSVPTTPDPQTNIGGDADPIDVVDVGLFTHKIGEVVRVKVVGVLGLIDEGETDWKVIAVNVADPKAHFINGPADLEVHKPGVIATLIDFFTNYKIPDGKGKNTLAFNGEIKDKEFALSVIEHHHEGWKSLWGSNASLAASKKYSLQKKDL